MITAGIDVGNRFTKALLLSNGNILSFASAESGFDQKKAAKDAFLSAVSQAGIAESEVERIIATGAGQAHVDFVAGVVTDIGAAAKGVYKIFPEARTIAEVGAETGKAINMDHDGRIKSFTFNDKCAAGVGSFVDSIGRILQIKPETMGLLALEAQGTVTINAQCAVFAESEVISLIHTKVPPSEISKAVFIAMAGRIVTLIRRAGLERELVVIGGVAKSQAFIAALEDVLQIKVLVDQKMPEYFSALGAALAAAEE